MSKAISNLMHDTEHLLLSVLNANGWVGNKLDFIAEPRIPVLAIYVFDNLRAISLTLSFTEINSNKMGLSDFEFRLHSQKIGMTIPYASPDDFLRFYGKSLYNDQNRTNFWAIEIPIDALSLLESYDRLARALIKPTLIKDR